MSRAFADHAAEFYAGSGNNHRRALELARINATNRPTPRAIKQAHAIGVSVQAATVPVSVGITAAQVS